MSSITAIVVVVLFTVYALASTDKKGDVKMVDLAEELARARQDLAKSREETKEIIRRENEKLKKEADKLKEEDHKLKEEDHKLKEENKSLREKDEKLQQQLTKLRHELHKANSDMKRTIRQKDQNITQELKKLMKHQIEEYLKENKLCVAGKFLKDTYGSTKLDEWITVDFHHTFPRVPTFSSSLNGIQLRPPLDNGYNTLRVDGGGHPTKVSRSSAKCHIYSDKRWTFFEVSWIACL